MLCKRCGENERYEYKGRVFALCADCITIAFAELFESLDEQRSPTLREADDGTCPYCAGDGYRRVGGFSYHCEVCDGAGQV